MLEDDDLEIDLGDDNLLDDDTTFSDDDTAFEEDTTFEGDDDTLMSASSSPDMTPMAREKPSTAMIAVLAFGVFVALGPLSLALSLVASPNGVYTFREGSIMTKVAAIFEPLVGLFAG